MRGSAVSRIAAEIFLSTVRYCHAAPSGPCSRLVRQRDALTAQRREGGGTEVGGGLDAGEPRAFEQRVEDRSYLGAPARLRAVVVLTPDHNAPERSLRGVVVDGYARVVEEDRKSTRL